MNSASTRHTVSEEALEQRLEQNSAPTTNTVSEEALELRLAQIDAELASKRAQLNADQASPAVRLEAMKPIWARLASTTNALRAVYEAAIAAERDSEQP